MSRTKHKYLRLFAAWGDNREFYKLRRRKIRHRNNNHLRTLTANYDVDDVTDKFTIYDPPKDDQWNEPTDGHWAISSIDPNRGYSDKYIRRKLKPKLKNP